MKGIPKISNKTAKAQALKDIAKESKSYVMAQYFILKAPKQNIISINTCWL